MGFAETYAKNYYERLHRHAEKFREEIDEFMRACDVIEEYEECRDCPLRYYCLKDESVDTIWNEVSITRLEEFLEYSDDVESKHTDPMYSQENWDNYQANESRQDF